MCRGVYDGGNRFVTAYAAGHNLLCWLKAAAGGRVTGFQKRRIL